MKLEKNAGEDNTKQIHNKTKRARLAVHLWATVCSVLCEYLTMLVSRAKEIINVKRYKNV